MSVITVEIIVALCTAFSFVLGILATLVFIYFYGGNIMEIDAGRVKIRMNNTTEYFAVVGKLKTIDAGMHESARKATTRLTILDYDKDGINTEMMLINLEARQPLLYAVYENNHTRKLAIDNGVENYIADKVYDVSAVVAVFRKEFPDLTDSEIEKYVYRWIKKAIIPNLQQACDEKIKYYQSLLDDKKVSKALKDEAEKWKEKNIGYLGYIEKLADCSEVQNVSTIIQTSP